MKPPPAVRGAVAAVAAVAAASLVALAAACGGGQPADTASPSSGAGGAARPALLAFAQCMRSRAVPGFPDPQPSSGGKFPSAQQLGVSQAAYQAAETACQRLLPAGVDDQFPPAEVQVLLAGMREFSVCVRSRGVPNWPDPSVNSAGQPFFDLSAQGISRGEAHSAPIEADEQRCQHLLPGVLGGVPVG